MQTVSVFDVDDEFNLMIKKEMSNNRCQGRRLVSQKNSMTEVNGFDIETSGAVQKSPGSPQAAVKVGSLNHLALDEH